MLSDELASYAASYQESRMRHSAAQGGLFLPLEVLVDHQTGTAHLSVSFSGSSSGDVYITRRASLIRAVKVTTKWLIIPWTVAKILTPDEFVEVFAGLVDEILVDGEPFWVLRAEQSGRLESAIASLELDEAFREQFDHGYLPESGAEME